MDGEYIQGEYAPGNPLYDFQLAVVRQMEADYHEFVTRNSMALSGKTYINLNKPFVPPGDALLDIRLVGTN